jgi:anti-sigma factor RsiW
MKNEKDNLEFLLSQYLDGQLEPQEMERMEDRLGGDLELRREFQRYAKLDEMLAEMRLPPELAAVDFDVQRQEIMAALERKSLLAGRSRFNVIRLTFAGVGALAAVAVIAVGTWLAIRTSTSTLNSSPLVRVEVVNSISPSRGQVSVSVAGPGLEDSNQAQVAVEYEQVPDNEFSLAAQSDQAPETWNAPTGTVLMVGVAPKQPDQPANNLADLLLE